MPTYEYRCVECGGDLEAIQSFTDEPLTTCGKCGGALRRVFRPVGIVLKGSGFYRTDSRNGKRSRSGTGETTKSESAGDDASKSDGSKKSQASEKQSSQNTDGSSTSDRPSESDRSSKSDTPKESSSKGADAKSA